MAATDRLLDRKEFGERVYARDKHKCVFCGAKADDPHHILDRKLYPDGGYYLNNGASVCNPCHMKCETGEFTVEQVRVKAGITDPIYPPGITADMVVDKWGNQYLEDGRRIKGPLFEDTAVQKLFKRDLWMFEDHE
jgi:hypothetical protein